MSRVYCWLCLTSCLVISSCADPDDLPAAAPERFNLDQVLGYACMAGVYVASAGGMALLVTCSLNCSRRTKRMNSCWRDVSEAAKGLTFMIGFLTIGGSMLTVAVAVSRLLHNPMQDGLLNASLMVFGGWPAIMLWAVFGYVLPHVDCLHTQLLNCVETEPTAAQSQDACEVVWCLDHFRWLHRTACRLRGRDYAALVQLAKKGQGQEAASPLPDHNPTESATLFDFFTTYASKHFPKNIRDVYRLSKSHPGDGSHDERRFTE